MASKGRFFGVTRATMAWLVLAVGGAVAAGACSTNDQCKILREHCDGNELIGCDEDEWSNHYVKYADDCAAHGQICVDDQDRAACVDNVPCTADTCAGNTLLTCVQGHVFDHFDCAESTPGRTCVSGAPAMCGYPP